MNHFLRVYIAFGGREASKKYIYTVSVSVFVSVDVVLCLKGSDDDDVHNHLQSFQIWFPFVGLERSGYW